MAVSRTFYRSLQWFLVLALLAASTAVLARDDSPFDPTLPAKSRATIAIEKLHPTQMAVGYWEVDRRAETIAHKNAKKLRQYLEEHLGQVVIGPKDTAYLVDGHHLALAMLRSARSDTIEVTIEANWRDLPPDEFWKKMEAAGWVYRMDEKGQGPIALDKLPKKIRDLRDDPYRSLAWAVRERGGYEKSQTSFAEFRWANYFRTRIAISKLPGDFDRAVEAALKLVHLPAAKDLPGYIPAADTDDKQPDTK